VLAIYTRLSARELLRRLMNIEREMGRVREERWGARIIDLDILLYGREVINEENLSVPHPLMHLRKFVLVPLVQLDPHLMHPTFGMSVAELLKRIPENGQEVIRVEDT
jgi:2-amino-4-hydroxy-6-hydroxymethyldihydropteridine diphosphokinase